MKYSVYIRKNKITEKSYIGITSKTLEERAGKNGFRYLLLNEDGKYKHPKFASAILKYGWESFESNYLAENLSLEEALELEKNLIIEYDSFNNGYNSSPGGDYVYDSSRAVDMIDLITGEVIMIFRSATAGGNFINKRNTNIVRCCKGTASYCGEYNSRKITWRYSDESNVERTSRENTLKLRKEKRESRRNKICHHADKKVSMFYSDDISEPVRTFNTIAEAAKFANIKSPSKISECCKGKRNIAGTYNNRKLTWRYEQDENSHEFSKNVSDRKNRNVSRYLKIKTMKPHQKRIIGTNLITGKILKFDSLKSAGEYLGMKNSSSIGGALHGRQLSAGGYRWEFEMEEHISGREEI